MLAPLEKVHQTLERGETLDLDDCMFLLVSIGKYRHGVVATLDEAFGVLRKRGQRTNRGARRDELIRQCATKFYRAGDGAIRPSYRVADLARDAKRYESSGWLLDRNKT